MTLSQSQFLLLLLRLAVTLGEDSPLCVLRADETCCVCNVKDIHQPSLSCLFTPEFELRDGKMDVSENISLDPDFAILLLNDHREKLIFRNITILSSFSSEVMPFQHNLDTSVQPLVLPSVKNLELDHVTVDPSLLLPSFEVLHNWLFGSLKSFVLVRSGLVELACSWALKVQHLTQLDLSENPVSLTSLQKLSHCPSLSFQFLKSLHLRGINLTTLQPLCALLSLTPALTKLDVSGNNFSILQYPNCPELKRLLMLNLSHSGITEVHLLESSSLEELDLSYNTLEVFNNPPKTLKKLNLTDNRLKCLPDNLPPLQELKVDGNQITTLKNETCVKSSTLEPPNTQEPPNTLEPESTQAPPNTQEPPNTLEPRSTLEPESTQGPPVTSGTPHHSPFLCLTLFIGVMSVPDLFL